MQSRGGRREEGEPTGPKSPECSPFTKTSFTTYGRGGGQGGQPLQHRGGNPEFSFSFVGFLQRQNFWTARTCSDAEGKSARL